MWWKPIFWSAKVLAVLVLAGACATPTRTLRGMVRIYGSEPHTYAAIVSGEEVYGVYPPEKERELRSLQGRDLEFKVRLLDRPAPPGFSGGMVTPLSWKPLD